METDTMSQGTMPSDLEVPGFLAGAVAAGIRYQGRPDLALIMSEVPAAAAGVFTTNKVQAAPVLLSRAHLSRGIARAILVNSGIANACTGNSGLEQARAIARRTAELVNCEPQEVLVASTGVIGRPLPLEAVTAHLPELTASASPGGWSRVARAIMTTDTVPKVHLVRGRLEDHPFTVLGIAKGAGMICPDMATLLAFVATDAAITPPTLQTLAREETERSFNRITVDGDTSTNDTLFVLANGRAGNQAIDDPDAPAAGEIRRAIGEVLIALARKIVADGEGATKLVEIRVVGAGSRGDALQGARVVANSPLVKTALFGEDANWGRIIAALGRAGIDFDPNRVTILFDGVKIVERGVSLGEEAERLAREVLKKKALTILIDLHRGRGQESVLTCDFSLDYVKINAHYTT
jgi:glutamate N-acetyltransferase/amino-acid N-acetyltransferase